jgi:hypothetical protein
MIKKRYFALVFLFFSIPIYSASFNFSSELSNEIYAYDNSLGAIVGNNKSELLVKLENSLKDEFTPSWIEDYVAKENLYGFSKSFSLELASILPLSCPYYFLDPIVGESETQIKIRCADERVITFIFDRDNYLVAVSAK